MPVSTPQLLALVLILFLGALSNATFGFGAALLAMPLMALVMEFKVASPLMALVAGTLGLLVLVHTWRDVDFRSIWRLFLGSVPGTFTGTWLLKQGYDQPLKLLLACILIGFAFYLLRKPTLPVLMSNWPGYFFGFTAGVLGAIFNTNGPPVVIFASLKRWPPQRFRATLLAFFFCSGLVVNLSHLWGGLWTANLFRLYLAALPGIVFAALLGHHLHHRIKPERFSRVVHILLILLGLLLAGQTIWKLSYRPQPCVPAQSKPDIETCAL